MTTTEYIPHYSESQAAQLQNLEATAEALTEQIEELKQRLHWNAESYQKILDNPAWVEEVN